MLSTMDLSDPRVAAEENGITREAAVIAWELVGHLRKPWSAATSTRRLIVPHHAAHDVGGTVDPLAGTSREQRTDGRVGVVASW